MPRADQTLTEEFLGCVRMDMKPDCCSPRRCRKVSQKEIKFGSLFMTLLLTSAVMLRENVHLTEHDACAITVVRAPRSVSTQIVPGTSPFRQSSHTPSFVQSLHINHFLRNFSAFLDCSSAPCVRSILSILCAFVMILFVTFLSDGLPPGPRHHRATLLFSLPDVQISSRCLFRCISSHSQQDIN